MPSVFKTGVVELEALCKEPKLQQLLAYFNARTAEWPHPLIHMELFTIGTFFDLGNAFKNDQAFDLLNTAAHFPWNDLPDFRVLLAIDLMLDLATASNTTEKPASLAENWRAIASRVASLDPDYFAWKELNRYYCHQI